MAADEFLAEEGARVESWLGGLLTRGLCLPDGLSVDQRSRELDAARAAAAELAGAHWGHGEAGIEARVQAAQFVAAHAAAMDWQAEANRRDLPNHARAIAQRLARQLMALTTSQLGALCRLKAERRREREEASRAAARQTAAQAKARIADRRALPGSAGGFAEASVAELERSLKAGMSPKAAADLDDAPDPDFEPDLDEMADLALAMAAPHPGTRIPGAAPADPLPASPPRPQPVGAGVATPPPEPAPPLNRRQRRALERLRRKEKQRDRVK